MKTVGRSPVGGAGDVGDIGADCTGVGGGRSGSLLSRPAGGRLGEEGRGGGGPTAPALVRFHDADRIGEEGPVVSDPVRDVHREGDRAAGRPSSPRPSSPGLPPAAGEEGGRPRGYPEDPAMSPPSETPHGVAGATLRASLRWGQIRR